MRIVIAGAGEVGTHLAKMLSNEEQDIIVLDTDEKKLYNLENYNLMTMSSPRSHTSDCAHRDWYCQRCSSVRRPS